MKKERETYTFEAAIVDPALERRTLLKGVLRAVYPRTRCHSFESVEHVASRANTHMPAWDVVFVSARNEGSLAHIVNSLKKTRFGADAVFIAVVSGKAAIATVASRIAEGFAAVLTESYSADSVAEVTALALALQKQQRASYERRVLRLLVREICDQVDTVAKLRKCRRSAKLGMYMLSEMCAGLPALSDEMLSSYFEELCEITSRGKPFKCLPEVELPEEESKIVQMPHMRMAGAI